MSMGNGLSQAKYNVIHGSFLVMNLIGFFWFCYHMKDIHFLIKFFSIQSFELALFYSGFSIIKSTKESKITQILYELSFTYNIITGLGYWIIVRPHIIDKLPANLNLCNDFTHTMPILVLVFIHYMQNLEYFHKENLKYQIYMMIVATIINIFYTFWDKPVYPFMTYEDIGTGIFLIGGLIMLTLLFISMSKFTQWKVKNSKTE